MKISKETINEVFEVANIEEVIGDFLELKKAGSNFKALSPFTDEKTPSLMVSPSKNIFKDFSSGKGGNAITFLMEHESLTYPEAISYLAEKYNIPIVHDFEADEFIEERKSRLAAFTEARRFYSHQNNVAIAYLKNLGFSEQTIDDFQVGYAYGFGEGDMSLLQHLRGNGFSLESIVQADLITLKSSVRKKLEATNTSLQSTDWSDYRDRFFDRMIFPVTNHMGKVVGFAGRFLKSDGFADSKAAKTAKFVNTSEETPFGKTGYEKRKVLYGLNQSKPLIRKLDFAIVSEGYTDVAALKENVLPAVGTGGTAFTYEHGKLLARFTKNAINIFDGDEAGLRAVVGALAPQYKAGLNPKAIFLPEGEDPEKYLHSTETPNDFEGFDLFDSLDAFIYAKKQLVKKEKLDSDDKWELLSDTFTNYFNWHEDKAKVLFSLTEFAKKLDIEPQVALEKYKQHITAHRFKQEKELFFTTVGRDVGAQFICNLLSYSSSDSSKVYARNFIEETPLTQNIFKPYQLELIDIIKNELFDPQHETYIMNISSSNQISLLESSITPITLLQQWMKEKKISQQPLEELKIFQEGFELNLENLSKLIQNLDKNSQLNMYYHTLGNALEKKDENLATNTAQTIKKLYYNE